MYVRGANPRDLSYQWFVNNTEITGANGLVLKYSGLRKHDEVRVRVSTKDLGECLSDPLVIANIQPKIQSAALLPSPPRKGNDLHVKIKTFDGDGDNVTVDYEWFINGEIIPQQALDDPGILNGNLIKRGDRVSVKITPSDGETRGRAIILESRVANSAPVVSDELETEFNGSVYSAKIKAFDPDGDTLTYTLKQAPEGMTIDPETGVITWLVTPDDEGEHDITVSVKDGHGGEIILPFSTTIGFLERTG
ncbi:MAG: Ig domain-containing protein [Nitrospirota bacterium]|nr:Ig domain-containing protein [Nitrospirota bacterium]